MAGENNGKKPTKSGAPSKERTTEVIKNPYPKKKTTGTATTTTKKTPTSSSGKAKPRNAASAEKTETKKVITSETGRKKTSPKRMILTVCTWFFGIIAAAIVIFFIVSLLDPIVYRDFYSSAEALVTIPGTKEGFVPQGLAYSDEADVYLISGYMQDKSESRIYIVTPEGESKELRLHKENGDKYTGHAGGISCTGNNVYLSNSGDIYYITLTTLLEASDRQNVRFEGSFEVPCSASFTFCNEDMLYVGEFFYDGYDTDDSHIISLENGGRNEAFVFGYSIDEKGEFGVKDVTKPEIIYSVRDRVQGFAVTEDGKIALSTSFSVADSHMYIYNQPLNSQTYYLDGTPLPLYVLDDGCLADTVTMPFMSEDLDVVNGDIIVSFESYAPKYGGGMLPFSINKVMKYSIDN